MNRLIAFIGFRRCRFLIGLGLALASPCVVSSQVIINEVLANNQTIAPFAEFLDYFPDYIEIYNGGTNDLDLGGNGSWSLVVEQGKATNYFSPGTIIGADSYLLVYCDKKTNFPGVHSFFGLSAKGDTVTLRHWETNTVITDQPPFPPVTNQVPVLVTNDLVRFGLQVPDYAIGRVPGTNPSSQFALIYPSPCGGTIPCQTNTPVPLLPEDTNAPITMTYLRPPPTSSNAMTLKINEWVALDTTGTGRATNDWFEVYNPDTNNIVVLSGLVFADEGSVPLIGNPASLREVIPLSFIAPGGFVQIFANSGKDPDEVNFSLSSTSGDEIYIFAQDRATSIDFVKFGPQTINGLPITANNPVVPNLSRGRIPDGAEDFINLPSATPDASNFGRIDDILITEVLSHTDPPLEDAAELQNVTSADVNIGGWWLSNDKNFPKKYRIPPNTIVQPGKFYVIYEYQFNTGSNAFTFNSAHGDECWLFKAKANGDLTGFRRGISFGPAMNGVSFGRYTNSDGSVDITATTALSFGTSVTAADPPSYLPIFRSGQGATNPPPKVGPLVINEIHYHPPDFVVPGVSTNDNSVDEFIELYNITDQPVYLYDRNIYYADRDYNNLPDGTSLHKNEEYADGHTNTWRIKGGVDYTFPAENWVVPARGFVLVVNFDPGTNAEQLATFRSRFPNLPPETPLFGPYKGKLSNGGATVDLDMPDPPQGPQHPDFRFIPRILVDHVKYGDKVPWPESPDAHGDSLQRIFSDEYGNEPYNWKGDAPTPGAPNGVLPPRITGQPQDKTVRVGANVTLSVTAAGTAPLGYQWEFNDTPISGATSRTLSLVNVSMAQGGAYRVVVSNSVGTATSREAILAVKSVVDILKPTVAITKPGATARLTNEVIIAGGTAKDNVGVEMVEYSLNGGTFNQANGSASWAAWDTEPISLNPGTNYLRARAIDYAGNLSLTNVRALFFSVPHPFGFSISGHGTVVGATNLQRLEIGRNYTLTATPGPNYLFSNWVATTNTELEFISTASKLTFMMQSNLAITANFVTNPFLAIKGAYNGLFHEADCVRNESSGFFSLTLADKGRYTASLQLAGRRYPASGQFNLDGIATNTITVNPTNKLSVVWMLDFLGSEQITGFVSNSVWTANLLGDRAHTYTLASPAPQQGKYTWVIPGIPGTNSLPEGDGFGTAVIDKANVASLRGTLAEGTPVSQRVAVSKNGHWPLYISLHSGKGSILSWVNFDTNAPPPGFDGELCWVRPALTSLKFYTNGFTNSTSIVGWRYVPPTVTTTRVLDITNGLFILSGGNLPDSYTNSITIGTNNKVTNNTPENKLTLSLTPATGLFSGTFLPIGTTKTVTFKGAVLQNAIIGSGYSLGTNRSARVWFEAAP